MMAHLAAANVADNVNITASSRILQATDLLEKHHRLVFVVVGLGIGRQEKATTPTLFKQTSLPFDERLPTSCKQWAH